MPNVLLVRLASFVAILATSIFLSNASVQAAAGGTFVITQIQYTDGAGAVQTAQVKDGAVQVPAIANTNGFKIIGTYTPNNPVPMFAGKVMTDGGANDISTAPTLNNGTWTVQVGANQMGTNKNVKVSTIVTGGAANTVMINNAVVPTLPVTLTVSAN